MALFWKGKTPIIANFLRTDLVICCHSREGKNQSYIQINMVMMIRVRAPNKVGLRIIHLIYEGSGGGVVDNTLDYQSRDCKIDPLLLPSFG